MFFSRKSEIKKVEKKFGTKKATEYLTYFNTYIQETLPLIKKGDNNGAKRFTDTIINKMIQEHGIEYANEFQAFLNQNLGNTKLIRQLYKAGDQYILPETLNARKMADALIDLFKQTR